MTTLITKLFIKDSENTSSPIVRQNYGILFGTIGILLNLLLFVLKFFAGTISNSISITADAFNNLSDTASSIITLIGFKLSNQKPDSEHPFGHGRLEYLTGLIISFAILMMAFELIRTSFRKISNPELIELSPIIIMILLISIFVKLYMAYFYRKISIKINSTAMKATYIDSLSDSFATFVILVASLIGYYTHLPLDGYCGVAVGFLIGFAGIKTAKETLSPLLGQPPSPEFVQQVEELVLSHEDIIGIHDLIVHDYGPGRLIISLHAEVLASGNFLALHDTIDNIERILKNSLNCVAVIHMDPIQNDDPITILLKEEIKSILSSISKDLSLHDFRIVSGPTHTNILFDILVPFNFILEDQAIILTINEKIIELDPNYYPIIEIDKKLHL